MNSTNTVYLIDASIYIFKYYFSLPDNWWSKEDYPTAAVYGYTHWLFRFLKASRPDYVAACFDESLENCFRNEIYPAYKSSRALPDESLAFQLEACKQITELLGIATYASDKYEADDLLGTLALRCRQKGHNIAILTRDKDLSQLLEGEQEAIWDYPDGDKLDRVAVMKKFGVMPEHLADYLALVGDKIDDIPGVPGLGPKGAAALISELGSWAKMKVRVPEVAQLKIRGAKALALKLTEHSEQIDMALKLSRIVCNAPLGRRYKITRGNINYNDLIRFGRHLGFGSRFETSVNNLKNELTKN